MASVLSGNRHVFGVKETIAAIQEVGGQVTKQAIRNSLLAGANVIRDEARRRASEQTGALKKSIVSQTRGVASSRDAKGRPTRHVAVVTIARKAFIVNAKGKATRGKTLKRGEVRQGYVGKRYPRNYAHLVEFGTKPHSLGKGSLTLDRKTKQAGDQTGAKHPGSRPKPFMRPAFDTKIRAAEQAMVLKLRSEVEKTAKRAAARAIKRAAMKAGS